MDKLSEQSGEQAAVLQSLGRKLSALKGLAMLAGLRQVVTALHSMEERCRIWVDTGKAIESSTVDRMRVQISAFRAGLGRAEMDSRDQADMTRIFLECEALLRRVVPRNRVAPAPADGPGQASQISRLAARLQMLKALAMLTDNPALLGVVNQAESSTQGWLSQQTAIRQSAVHSLRAGLMSMRVLIHNGPEEISCSGSSKELISVISQCEESLNAVEKSRVVTNASDRVVRKFQTMQSLARGLGMTELADDIATLETYAVGWRAGRVTAPSLRQVKTELWNLRARLGERAKDDPKLQYIGEMMDETERMVDEVEINA